MTSNPNTESIVLAPGSRVMRNGVRIRSGVRGATYQVRINKKWQTFKSFEEARAVKAASQPKANAIVYANPTVSEYLDGWLATLQVRESTRKRYNNCIRHIKQSLGGVLLTELSAPQIRNCIYNLDLSPATKAIVLTVLNAACQQAVNDSLLTENPCANVQKPKDETKSLTRRPLSPGENFTKENILSPSDIKELLEILEGTSLWLPVYVLWTCGLRRGELLALKWRDVDFNNLQIHIRSTATEERTLAPPKTKRSAGIISIPEQLANELRKHYTQPDHFVFADPDSPHLPVRPGTFCERLKRKLKKTRFARLTPHHLRHAHGSALLDAGWSIARVANRLRDSQATLVKTYSHELRDADDSGLECVLNMN